MGKHLDVLRLIRILIICICAFCTHYYVFATTVYFTICGQMYYCFCYVSQNVR